jgi:hypothetical protein
MYKYMVRLGGLEPPRVASQAPQACVSTIPPQSLKLSYKNLEYFPKGKERLSNKWI